MTKPMCPAVCRICFTGAWIGFFLVALILALMPSPAMAQAVTNFGSNSGVACPVGNVICNGSINFLTTELFFEPETPAQGLKEALVTWNEVEYLLDNPYVTGGNGNPSNIGPPCNDGSGPQPVNEQGFPSYCTPTTGIFGTNIRRPAFGVTHPVRTGTGAGGQGGALTNVPGLSPLRVHPLNYNSPNGNEQRVLNPNYAGDASFDNTGVCYTLSPTCTPPTTHIPVSAGSTRLNPADTPEIDYDTAYGRKRSFCQNNPEPVPLGGVDAVTGLPFGGAFQTSFDSENLNVCGSDPGEPGAAALINPAPPVPVALAACAAEVAGVTSSYLCEDNLGLPRAGQPTSSWYSVPAVPAGSVPLAMLRQIPPGTLPFLTGSSIPIQPSEMLVDPGARGTILPYDPTTGVGGLKKPTLRSAAVGGTGISPNYVWNSAGAARPDPIGANLQFSNENDYYGLYVDPNTNGYSGVTAANFYARKQAARLEAARLGKSLFWDMQVGSDGVQSCGSCHAHAGADNRTKNQVNPFGQNGIPGNPTNFDTSGAPSSFTFPPNHDLLKTDFPFHYLSNPEIAGDPLCTPAITGDVTGISFPDGDPPDNPLVPAKFTACDAANNVANPVNGVKDTDDVASSMGVHFGYFSDIPAGTGTGLTNPAGPTSPFGPASVGGVRALIRDQRAPLPAGCIAGTAACDLNIDPIAGFAGMGGPTGFNEYRRVEPRNTPTIFLAQFNFDNFWDGRARHDDNGGSVFGPADPQSHMLVDQTNSGTLTATRQLVKFSSIASLAKGPGLSKFEMSYLNRNWAKVAKKLLQAGVTPLANQLVDPTDSILGPYSNQAGSLAGGSYATCAALPAADQSGSWSGAGVAGKPGLCISYNGLIRHAFYPALHQNTAQHLYGCYTDAFVSDGILNPAVVAVHPNQCGTGIYPAASIATLDADGVVRNHDNDPFDTFVLNIAAGPADPKDTNQFTHMEGNFAFFWGQSINAWASLLVPDDTPYDRFAEQNPDEGITTGETGEPLLVTDTPTCGENGTSPFPAGYVRDFEHGGCFREVGNFKRDVYNPNDIVGTPAKPVQNDTTGHPRMSACIKQLTFNGETGTRICTQYVPAGGTRVAAADGSTPDPLLGLDIFFGSNLSLKNPQFRSARCGACHNAPALTDHTTSFTHKWTLVDAAAEFAHDNPLIEPLQEPLSKQRIISGFHLESETNGPGQDAIERKSGNLSIVPAPVAGVNTSAGSFAVNGNCITDTCSGYNFPDGITLADNSATQVVGAPLSYVVHKDLGSGPVAGPGDPVPFTSFGGSFFDNGVYNIGVRPCVADQSQVTGACEDAGRGNTDGFGWPLSLAALLMKVVGGTAQQPGTPIPGFDPANANAGGRVDALACAPYCATGGLYPLNGHDQRINSGYTDDPANPLIPGYIAAGASHISVGDAHPQLDEACGPTGGCFNTLSDTANAEGFPEMPFDPRAHLSEVINNAVANGDATFGGVGFAEQGTWPFVNRVNRFGAIKAPQLREVELTGPYFHNGGKLTLRQVVDFYVRGGDFPVTNAHHRDFNILNLNAELQSDLSELEKVALVDFMLELTDDRVALEAAPFDHPQMILPLDGTAPESDGTINRDAMLTGCVAAPTQFGPGQQFCAGNAAAIAAATGATGSLFLNVPATGAAGNPGGRIPNFLGIAGSVADAANPLGRQRLVGAAANCGANITSQYCH